jgi:putative tricarboxylic transport membrane protein
MGALSSLIEGFGTALTPENLLYAFAGVLLGTAIGVLPGIGPAMTIALLLPLTRGLDVTSALIMFAGIYYGGMYGGSTTSILLNTPGESASVVTAIEGNKMAKAGRAAQALASRPCCWRCWRRPSPTWRCRSRPPTSSRSCCSPSSP